MIKIFKCQEVSFYKLHAILEMSKRYTFFLHEEIRDSGRCVLVLKTCIYAGILRKHTGNPPGYTGKDLSLLDFYFKYMIKWNTKEI